MILASIAVSASSEYTVQRPVVFLSELQRGNRVSPWSNKHTVNYVSDEGAWLCRGSSSLCNISLIM